ncbi:MAG: PhzF family phenazine biosynthesis protein [Enhydrobacter sp.]
MKRQYVTVDVFTDRPFGGNPLAVVLDAQGLSTERMQAIAAEFNYAETTFVLPPTDPAHTAHVRIFTPKAEMPFAGHPNVGTAFVLARANPDLGDRLLFEEKAGLVPMDIVRDKGVVIATRLAAPQQLSFGEEVTPALVAEACALDVRDIKTDVHPPIVASCGAALLFVELVSRAALAKAKPLTDVFAREFPRERFVGIHLYVQAQEEGREIQCRMFAPEHGIPEDPATGGANVALIGVLAHFDKERDFTLARTIGQGFDMGRPSVLEARAEKIAGTVTKTYVGGRCVQMMSGALEID